MKTLKLMVFHQLLISVNLHRHAENQAFSSIRSSDTVDLEILQSRVFWPVSQEPEFSPI